MRKRAIIGFAAMCLLVSACEGQTLTSDPPPKVTLSKALPPKPTLPKTMSKTTKYLKPWEDKNLIQAFETCYAENGAEKALKLCDFNRTCQDIEGFDKMTMSYCAQTTRELWKVKLTEEYERLMVHMRRSDETVGVEGGSKVEALKESQRAWMALRDSGCRDEYSYHDGAERRIHVGGCMMEKTRQRTVALNKDRQYLDRG